MRLLLDADAFLCLRKLSVLDLLRGSEEVDLIATEFIARHELSPLQADVKALEKEGRLRVEAVTVRTPAHQTFRQLRKEGVDKGEAEAIAWAMCLAPDRRPLFVSNDAAARRCAERNGVPVVDVMGLAVEIVEGGVLSLAEVRERLAPWEDSRQSFGRPGDFSTFDETYRRRAEARQRGQPTIG